jgi:site-specific recombinase XerD
MVAGRAGHRPATRPQGEERLAECPPDAGPDEIRALRRLQREQGPSSHVFMTERDGPMTPKAFHALYGRIGARAKMPFLIHPHMLRHGCGYALANAGHDTRALQAWLGHKNIQHTVRYTELSSTRFKDFWR